jgi:hypothetical protein
MWAYITSSYNLWTINDSYGYNFWKNGYKGGYKGTFTLIDPRYQKPEVLKVGQKVRIMESARECGTYNYWDEEVKYLVGAIDTIEYIDDDSSGVRYKLLKYGNVPHYCVMPVEEEEIQEIPELGNTLEELDNLVSKAQDIISKYKK